MRFFFLAALAAYLCAAVSSVFLFITKRAGYERTALVCTLAGLATHTAALVRLWRTQSFDALFQLQAELSVLAWALALAYLFTQRRWQAHALGSLLLPTVAVLMIVAAALPQTTPGAEALLTAEEAAWLFPAHTLMLLFAYGAFFVVFAARVIDLLQGRELKSKTFGRIFHRLPSLATVEQIGTIAAAAGWTLLTGGIITGMLWSAALVATCGTTTRKRF